MNTRHTDHWDYSRESPKEKRERLFEEVQRATTKEQQLQLMEELYNSEDFTFPF